jgi:tetratricopeptide (TPR) repeat protein
MMAATLPFLALACLGSAVPDPLSAARDWFAAGEYERAARVLEDASKLDPHDARLAYWEARCRYERADYDRAIERAQHAVELAPDDSRAWQWLGRAYGGKAERSSWFSGFSLARQVGRALAQAVKLDASNLEAQRDLIEFYLRAPGLVGGGKDRARRQVERLSAIDAAEGHLARGDLLLDEQELASAEAEYRAAFDARPPRVGVCLEVADFYRKRGQAARMEEAVEAAAAADALDPRLDWYRAVARVLAGDRLAEAEQLLTAYLRRPPSSERPSPASAREWLGRLYERQDRRELALAQYRAALALDPDRREARAALGRLGR